MTKSSAASNALLNELVTLLRLTRAEAQIARVRVVQAKRDDIRRELEDNASEADTRSARIQDAIRQLGGTPDILADAFGRVTALTKVTTEQVQPLSEGLLGDLALEHQLLDRVVFARVLAEASDESSIVALTRDLEKAHNETIEWIRLRLAELAQGGPVTLAPTPTQVAVGAVARLATLPSRQGLAILNKAADIVQRGRVTAQQAAESTLRRTREAAEATEEVVNAGRDAALRRTEEVAPSATVRKAVHELRENLGTVDPEDLPIEQYDDLTNAEANEQINALDDPEQVRLVLAYELAHANRKRVTNTAERRLTQIAEESVGA